MTMAKSSNDIYPETSRLILNSHGLPSLFTLQKLTSLHICNVLNFNAEFNLLRIVERCPTLEILELHELLLPCKLPEMYEPLKQLKVLMLRSVIWIHDQDQTLIQEEAVVCFLDQLIGESKLEVLQLLPIKNMGIEILSVIGGIFTLRELELKVPNPIMLDDTKLVNFFGMLAVSKRIEKLTLHNLYSLQFAVFDALSKLKLLRQLHITIEPVLHLRFENPIYADKKGFQQLLLGIPFLVDVKLEGVRIPEDESEMLLFNQIVRRQGQHPIGCSNFFTSFENWFMEISAYSSNCLFDADAKRVESWQLKPPRCYRDQ